MSKDSLAQLYTQCRHSRSAEDIVHAVGADFEAELDQYGIELSEGADITYHPETEQFVLTHPHQELDRTLQPLLNLSAERTLRTLLPDRPGATYSVGGSGEEHPFQTGLTWFIRGTFWLFNGVLGFVFVWWVVRLLTSADYRSWYTTELLAADGGYVVYIFTFLLVLTPVASAGMGALALRRGLPRPSLARLFFVFELPALLLIMAAEAVLRNVPLTTGLRYLFATLLIVAIGTWWQWIIRYRPQRGWSRLLWLTQNSFLLIGTGYLFLLLVVPTYIWGSVEILFEFEHVVEHMLLNPMAIFVALVYLGMALIPLGFASLALYQVTRSYLGACRSARPVLTRFTPVWVGAVTVCFFGALILFSRPASLSPYDEPLILLSQEDAGYAGLAARAEPLIGTKDTVDRKLAATLLREQQFLFQPDQLLDMSDREPQLLGRYLYVVGFPFVDRSDADTQVDSPELRRGYQRAFGTEPPRSLADLNTVERRQVQHTGRDISFLTQNPDDIFAEVTVTDSFSTFMPRDQEVILEFTLPEHAVITDLRLGPNLQHEGQIAPRGAAQQVYAEEVRQRIDPALLEQTGPRQYRLRVYPVPGTSDRAARLRREEVRGPTQRVQFSYLTMREPAGIPLPVYTQTYNLLDGELKETLTLHGEVKQRTRDGRFLADPRAPEALCNMDTQVTVPVSRDITATLTAGENARFACVTGERVVSAYQGVDLDIAILIDTSYANHGGALEQQLAQLRAFPESFFAQNTVSIQLFSDEPAEPYQIGSRSEVPRADELVYFGRGNTQAALAAVEPATDAVLVVSGADPSFTDGASAPEPVRRGLGARRAPTPEPTAQFTPLENLSGTTLVFLHPPGAAPPYPVGVRTLLAPARDVSVSEDPQFTLSRAFSNDRYAYEALYWDLQFAETDSATTTPLVPQFSGPPSEWDRFEFVQPLAARAFIMAEQREVLQDGGTDNARFDELHTLAKEVGIVTSLSSYLALVNQRQQDRLDQLSGESDRYTNTQRFTVQQPTLQNPLGGGGFASGFMAQSTGLQSDGLRDVPTVDSRETGGTPSPSNPPEPERTLNTTEPNDTRSLVLGLLFIVPFFGAIASAGWFLVRSAPEQNSDSE